MALPAGTRLGPYEILTALGAGGMGEVYAARDTRLERDVAVKVLPAHLSLAPQARERLQREARAVAALSHPNICTIYDVGNTGDGGVFLVMELLQGETLQQRLLRGPLDAPALVDTAIALADALDAAHGAGIIHRDIKPANVFLTARGPKVLDFGLAKADPRRGAGASADTTMSQGPLVTDPGSIVGTAAYMSPEQLRGEALDARTDLFSLGLVLYEMATGRRAFTGATSAVLTAAILHEHPPAPREVRPGIPERLDDVVLKAIEKDRSLRYQHASDIRADLQRLKRDSESVLAVAASAATMPVRATRWKTAAAVAAAVVLLATGYLAWPRSPVLTDKDTIVLAEFVNRTGDAVFDETLRQGLAVQLEQSPFLSLISDERIRRTLTLMNRPPDARLTPDIARDVCIRTGSTVVLEGSITSLGREYVLGFRATNCATGDVFDNQQEQAPRKEEVLGALSRIASRFRTRAGESLATVRQHSVPLEEATTSSPEALKTYTAAVKAALSSAGAQARRLYTRAIELDPEFAMAYARLGLNYATVGEWELARKNTIKSYDLRGRVTDRERFFIMTMYDRQVTGNIEREDQTLASWIDAYPRDANPHGLIGGLAATSTGRYQLSIDEADRAIALDPDLPPAYGNKARNNLLLGRLPEAEAALRAARDRKLTYPAFLIVPYLIAVVRDDAEGMARAATEATKASGALSVEDTLLHVDALGFARAGRLEDARKTARSAVDLATRAGQGERAATYQAAIAVSEAFYGNAAAARQAAADALAIARGRDVDYAAAFALPPDGQPKS